MSGIYPKIFQKEKGMWRSQSLGKGHRQTKISKLSKPDKDYVGAHYPLLSWVNL